MKLSQLAVEFKKDPIDLMVILMRSPVPFLVATIGGERFDLSDVYGMRIETTLVEQAREFITKQLAQEVLDHVQGKEEGDRVEEPWNDDEDAPPDSDD